MAMEGIGIGLALLAELNKAVQSILERNACYKAAPAVLKKVDDTLVRLTCIADKMVSILRANPETIPPDLLVSFAENLATVKETLKRAETAVNLYYSKAFLGTRGGGVRAVMNKGLRFVNAKTLSATMQDIEREACGAESKLQHLLTQLTVALKSDQMENKIGQHLALQTEDLRSAIESNCSQRERFRPAFNAPMLPAKVHLDFVSRDFDGNISAPEARFKSFLLHSTCPGHMTVARGANGSPHPVHGVCGMAGVGKSIALIALGHDADIKARFVHGVLFMSIGAAANAAHVICELSKIMRVTGATESATEVQSSTSLAEAVSNAAIWFHGKRILFLIDDIWPSAALPEGFLPDLEGLLQGSPESQIALSTRSLQVAEKAGSHVDFGTRDPCGPISVAMFMASAAPGLNPSSRQLEAAQGILQLCSGLPIALSVAGAAVSLRLKSGLGFEYSCRKYFEKLSDEMALCPGASFLHNAIRSSLEALEAESEKNGNQSFSLLELYTSLCVLENQQFAPVPVLARMWNISETKAESICMLFTSMSLAKLSTRILAGREECGMYIHDLHLDYCRQHTALKGDEEAWHQRLLDGHMRCDAYVNEGSAPCIDGPLSLNMFDCTPRPWWKQDCPNKEYMHKHLSRHLRRAGLLRELGSTILDLRWISAQGRAGGILGLKNDLCVLESATTEEVVKAPIMRIAEVAISNSGSLHMGLRVLSHIFLAHLFRLGKTNEWIYRFLERLKDATPKPYLDAMVTFYEPRGDDLKFDIDYMPPSENGDAYLTTDFSTCDRYLAAGANRDVVVFSLDTQNRLKWCKGHEKDVSVVKFSSDASMIISGSLDNNVIVWDWQSSESPALTLRGHKGAVTSLSLSSDDCSIFSGSRDGTVKIWNICTGELCHEFEFADAVESVSASPISEIVAVGMRNGHLRCMNSASGDCLFEQNMLDVGLLSALQFATDGKFLVCGSAKGKVASWRAVDWRKAASVYMPGSVANIAFHPDGTNVIVATSEGEIRNWNVAEEKLASYNIALARPVNGLSFRNCGKDVIVGTKLGYARAWSGPQSNPNLDFEDFRKNVLHDFTLSSDGTRVATSTHDSIIRIWNSDTGSEFSAYPAPEDGSRRLVLNGDGNKIASVSPNGIVQVWNADMPPGDGDISFTVDDKNVSCLSFSPDNIRLLVSLNDEVLVWNLDSRQELRRLPSFGCSESSFSADGRFIIVGNSMRTIIRDAMSSETVFDSSSISSQMMSFSEAENVTTTCGPSAHRMWPISIRNPAADLNSAHGVSSATELTAGNIFNFATYHFRAVDMLFCRDKFILNHYGVLGIYKLQK